MAKARRGGKVSQKVVIAGALSVAALYSTGYVKTQAAAERLEIQSEHRRPAKATPAAPTVAAPLDISVNHAPVPPVNETPSPVAAQSSIVKKEVAALPEPAVAVSAPGDPISPPASSPFIVAAPTAAPGPPPPMVPEPAKPKEIWKDGTYTGWGHSRHGDIQASVLIENGRIISSKIAQCLTRYSCDVIDAIIPQPPQRQSADVDAVGGATQSSDAFYYAVSEALSKAK